MWSKKRKGTKKTCKLHVTTSTIDRCFLQFSHKWNTENWEMGIELFYGLIIKLIHAFDGKASSQSHLKPKMKSPAYAVDCKMRCSNFSLFLRTIYNTCPGWPDLGSLVLNVLLLQIFRCIQRPPKSIFILRNRRRVIGRRRRCDRSKRRRILDRRSWNRIGCMRDIRCSGLGSKAESEETIIELLDYHIKNFSNVW